MGKAKEGEWAGERDGPEVVTGQDCLSWEHRSIDLWYYNNWSEPNKSGVPSVYWMYGPPSCPPGLMSISYFCHDQLVPVCLGLSQFQHWPPFDRDPLSRANWDDWWPSTPPSPWKNLGKSFFCEFTKGRNFARQSWVWNSGPRTETLKAESQDARKWPGCQGNGLLGGQHVFQCILSVTKYRWWETTCQCPRVGTAYVLFTRSLSLVPRVAEVSRLWF